MGPEPTDWDDYLQPDPRERNTKYRTPLDDIREKITSQEFMVSAVEAALETARNRLAELHRQHAELVLADAEHENTP
jgi:hypothetical protein